MIMKYKSWRYPPEELTFTISTGEKYLHYGRDIDKDGNVLEHVKNLKTGKRKTFTEEGLIKLKQR